MTSLCAAQSQASRPFNSSHRADDCPGHLEWVPSVPEHAVQQAAGQKNEPCGLSASMLSPWAATSQQEEGERGLAVQAPCPSWIRSPAEAQSHLGPSQSHVSLKTLSVAGRPEHVRLHVPPSPAQPRA